MLASSKEIKANSLILRRVNRKHTIFRKTLINLDKCSHTQVSVKIILIKNPLLVQMYLQMI